MAGAARSLHNGQIINMRTFLTLWMLHRCSEGHLHCLQLSPTVVARNLGWIYDEVKVII